MGRWPGRLLAAAVLIPLFSCGPGADPPAVVRGQADLTGRDWTRGPVDLTGTWAFGNGYRPVPDTWKGGDAGGPDGRGWGVYRLDLKVPPGVPLALRWGTAATAMTVRVDGVEAARAGQPSPDPRTARPGYAPGVVRLPEGSDHRIEVIVSNHEYRVGGLWWPPQVGPADQVVRAQWLDEVLAGALAAGLGVIGLGALLLFFQRPRSTVFFHLAVFSLLIAGRSLVTGEYPLVKLWPGVGFNLLIRLEYLTAFLPLPAAALYFSSYFPGMTPRWAVRTATWPLWLFGAAAVVLPLDLLTRVIPAFYPVAVPILVAGTVLVIRHCLVRRSDPMVLAGVVLLAGAGLADMIRAAFFSATGNLIPLGLGVFTLLQALSLARQFLRTLEDTQALVHQKELLVKEIHHRVKNSLQVVASLLSLQANRTPEPAQKEVFRTMRRRVVAIAAVHERLFHQGGEEVLDLGAYLRDLLEVPNAPEPWGERRVRCQIPPGPVPADLDACVDAGLIVTELVSNAQKHAGAAGETVVRAAAEGRTLTLEVSDDGPGFPEGFRSDQGPGLGFRLISSLLPRRNGTLTVGPGPGGLVRVTLSLPSVPGEPSGPPPEGPPGPPA